MISGRAQYHYNLRDPGLPYILCMPVEAADTLTLDTVSAQPLTPDDACPGWWGSSCG